MSDTRKKLLTRIILALLVLWIAGQAVISAARYINGRQARQRGDAWLQEAQDDANPDMTPDDAVRWLKGHGVQAYRGETAWVNGQEIEKHTITGWQVLNRKSLWTEPLTAELTFDFDANWRFSKVQLQCRPYESP